MPHPVWDCDISEQILFVWTTKAYQSKTLGRKFSLTLACLSENQYLRFGPPGFQSHSFRLKQETEFPQPGVRVIFRAAGLGHHRHVFLLE